MEEKSRDTNERQWLIMQKRKIHVTRHHNDLRLTVVVVAVVENAGGKSFYSFLGIGSQMIRCDSGWLEDDPLY